MKKLLFSILLVFSIALVACAPDECAGNDTCYFDKALATDDEFQCSKIENSAIQKSCFSQIAIQRNDTQLCSALNSSFCILSIAENTQKPELCSTIENQQWHDTCFQDLAIGLNKSSLCRSIMVDDSQDACHMEIAKQLNETSLCYFIINSQQRDLCIARRSISKLDSNGCYEIQEPVIKANCYYKIAQYTGKEKICDNIQIGLIRNECKADLQG